MKISLKHIILFFFALVCSDSALAQEYQVAVNRLSFEDGLSNRKVNNICQDTFGFIWIATENGLNRYDGHSFKQYFSGSSGLRNNRIDEVYADVQGRIWCVHYKTYINNVMVQDHSFANQSLVDVFDPQTESFQPFDSLTHILQEGEIVSFHKAIDGKLYFSTIDGRIFNAADLSKPIVSIRKDRPFHHFIFRENGIWTLGDQVISHYSFEGELIEEEKTSIQVFKLEYRDENSFWVIPLLIRSIYSPCWKIYLKRDGESTVLYEFTLEDKPVYRRVERRMVAQLENGLEIHIHQGVLYLYDSKSKQVLEELPLSEPSLDYLPRVSNLFKDRTGIIWVSTSFGIFIINVSDEKFKVILEGKSARSIFQLNEDSLMIFTYDGTFIQNTRNKQIEKSKDSDLRKHGLVGVAKIDQEYVIAGGHSSNLLKINTRGELVDTFNFPSFRDGLHLGFTFIIESPSINKLWLGTRNGLFEFDESARTREPFLDHKGQEAFKKKYIRSLAIDESGMWVMTDSGFYLVNTDHEVTEILWNNRSFGVRSMYTDKEGIRWLSVFNNGIMKWDRSANEMIHLNTNNGLSNNNVYVICEDNYGYLWLPSDYGLMRINKEDFSIQVYLDEDGIAHNEFNHTSQFINKEGLFYFGGLNGITCFNPADFLQKSKTGDMPVITSIKFVQKEKDVLEDRTALLRKKQMITLNPEDQSFVMEMMMADYRDPERQSFAYRIEGLENQWTEIKENFVRINRLPYGDYKILLKARHLGERWSDQILGIPLRVERPVYLKPWFLGLLILAILGLTFLTIHWRLRWLEKDKERLQQEVELRTQKIEEQKIELEALNQTKDRFFAIIAHDLRGPVISFRGLSKKVSFLIRKKQTERLNELGESIDYAAFNLEKLLDNLLNWALIQNGSLPFHPKMIAIQPLIEETLVVFEGMYESKSITITTEIQKGLFAFADINGLSAIIRNLLSNAIKYSSEGGSIRLYAKSKEDQALIQIEDSGEGMPDELIRMILNERTQHIKSTQGTKGEKGTGLGLKLCKELIELHKGSMKIRNNEGVKGITIQVYLPLSQTLIRKNHIC